MLCVGDKDGASDWHQDIEFYNLARRAGKDVVMLVYPGENHSLAKKPIRSTTIAAFSRGSITI